MIEFAKLHPIITAGLVYSAVVLVIFLSLVFFINGEEEYE